MKAFVLGGSFVETTVINMLDYLLNIKINQFIIVEENHSYDERLIKDSTDIGLCKNMEDGIKQCDLCIIIKSKYLSDVAIEKARSVSKKSKKQIIELEYCFDKDRIVSKEYYLKNMAPVPAIFNISIGEFHPSVQTEIIIHKVFSNLNLNVYYEFSKSVDAFLLQTGKTLDFLNCDGINKKYDVLFFSQHYDKITDLFNDYSLIQKFIDLCPDCLLLNIEAGFTDIDTLENIFKYRCNKQVDQFIISDYFHTSSFTNDYRPVYYLEKNNSTQTGIENNECGIKRSKFVFASDKAFLNKLGLCVVSKIALPKEIHIL